MPPQMSDGPVFVPADVTCRHKLQCNVLLVGSVLDEMSMKLSKNKSWKATESKVA